MICSFLLSLCFVFRVFPMAFWLMLGVLPRLLLAAPADSLFGVLERNLHLAASKGNSDLAS